MLELVGLRPQIGVTPLGNPETDIATFPLKPYCPDTFTVVEAELPWPKVMVLYVFKVNDGAITSSVIGAVAVNDPDVPVTVTVLCPTGAVLLAVKLKLEVLVVGLVENVAVIPGGRFVTVRFTLPEKPFSPKISI